MTSDYWERFNRGRVSRRALVRGGAITGVGIAGIALVGCGSNNNKNTGNANSAANSNNAATKAAAASAAAPASTSGNGGGTPRAGGTAAPVAGKRGGAMKLSKSAKDTGLDPQITVTNPLHECKAYNHSHTYRFSTNEILFDAAVSYEQTDPTTLVFHLRPGLTFGDQVPNGAAGRPMTSDDFAYTYGRFPTTLAKDQSQVNQIQWGWMDSFQTPDKQTVVIKQKTPFASNLAAMGSMSFGIVAREVVEANNGRLDNVLNAGGGPYQLTQRDDTGTKYVRNTKYYKHDNPSPTYLPDAPFIDEWDERIISDSAAVKAAFLSGDLDILDTSEVPIDKQVAAELAKSNGITVVNAPANTHLIMAMDQVKWTDARLRQAISLTIDRDAFISNLYLGDGLYGGPVSAGFTQGTDNFAFAQADLKKYSQYDPKQAKDLWSAAGGNQAFPNGLKMTTMQAIPLFANATQFIADGLKKALGIQVNVEVVDPATYVAKATAPTKDWDLFVAYELSLLTIPDYNALTHYVPQGYGAIFGNLKPDSSNPQVAQLAKQIADMYTKQASTLDYPTRKQAMDDLQKFLLTNFAPVLPLPVQATAYGAFRNRVKNFPVHDFQYPTSSSSALRVQDIYLES